MRAYKTQVYVNHKSGTFLFVPQSPKLSSDMCLMTEDLINKNECRGRFVLKRTNWKEPM